MMMRHLRTKSPTRKARQRIDLSDLDEPPQTKHELAVPRRGAADESALRNDRDTNVVAPAEDRCDLLCRPRDGHGERLPAEPACEVVSVRGDSRLAAEDNVVADKVPECVNGSGQAARAASHPALLRTQSRPNEVHGGGPNARILERLTSSRTSVTGRDESSRLVGSAIKCLTLLEALAGEPGPVGVSELARRTDASRGTTYQRLRTLVAAGWVEQIADGRYRLTLRPLMVGSAVLEQADMGSRILPTLTSLAARTGETASLAVLDREAATIIQRVAPDRTLKADIKAGTRMPLETSASGRVLVAFGPDHVLAEARRAGVPMPSDSIVAEARRCGWAQQQDEYLPGMSSVAVPIDSPKMGLVALAITAPSGRYDRDAALAALRAGAAEIKLLLQG